MGAPSDLWATVWTTISRGDDATGKRELDQLLARDRAQATHGMTKAGLTLLHQAASSGCAECARVLLEHGAEPSHTSRRATNRRFTGRRFGTTRRSLVCCWTRTPIVHLERGQRLATEGRFGQRQLGRGARPRPESHRRGVAVRALPPGPHAAGTAWGPREALRVRTSREGDEAPMRGGTRLCRLLRTLKAHDKESRLLRKLLEQSQQTHGLGSSADRLGTVLQQQLRAAEDSRKTSTASR